LKIYQQLNNGIKIVEYDPSFAQGICDMWTKSGDDWGGQSGIQTPSQIIAEHAGAANFNVYLALDGDAVVGYCSLARYYYDANTAYIPLLNVQQDYHGKGIGKALVLQCVNRTIELGYPRIDLYTWPGNTAAVPLYKKCGYLWEDRPNSTHLTNFIPTILKLFPEFFSKADWYKDSTRVIEVKPDGEKVNEFECFGYSWAKDDETLAVGFERSGKQIRHVETQDYSIKFMAENQKLAYGLDYDCEFILENKTGKPLHIEIRGKEDANISFGLDNDFDIDAGQHTIKSKFHVGSISEPQDIWKVHPCLSADVIINGEAAIPFGLGIETRFPLTVELHHEVQVSQIGVQKDCYINITSALSHGAVVSFSLPDNDFLSFVEKSHTIPIVKRGKASIKVSATTLGIGYHELPITYKIAFEDGSTTSFEKPLRIINQDLTGAFGYEEDVKCGIINGPWRLEHDKEDNEVYLEHILVADSGEFAFEPPKLGLPYDDEFNLIKPMVRSYQQGPKMVMEGEYVSGKFPGMVITQIVSLTATGLVTRRYRVENRGDSLRAVVVSDPTWIPLQYFSRFMYRGKMAITHDGQWADAPPTMQMDDIELEDWSENWVFEADPSLTKGICWAAEYKPSLKWGNHLSFEIDLGEMAPGQIIETKPLVLAYGMFSNANDFRNYALGIYNRKSLDVEYSMDFKLNGYNPIVHGREIEAEFINNRSIVLEGEVNLESLDNLFDPQAQTNKDNGEVTPGNKFSLAMEKPMDAIGIVRLSLDLTQFKRQYNRGLFFPSGDITTTKEGSLYTVSNGVITFKADTAYSNALFSMETKGDVQWLDNRYPNHEPYGFANPYIGGIQMRPSAMNPMTMLKECITASFEVVTDNYGNKWQGIRTTLTITEFEDLRGGIYESYFLTLPGLPLLCRFFRFINNTGVFKEHDEAPSAYPKVADKLTDVYIEGMTPDRYKFHQRAGIAYQEMGFTNTVKLSGDRSEKMYIFHGNKMTKEGHNGVHWDNKTLFVYTSQSVGVGHGETYTSKPTFYLVTDRDLPEGALDDFERLVF